MSQQRQYELLRNLIATDDTFTLFREVIAQSGRAWTGQSQGFAVVVGQGEYSGAQPDVATISLLTGKRMAKEGDLFLGEDGFLYLSTGNSIKPKKVTAIYSRAEETFLFQEGSLMS